MINPRNKNSKKTRMTAVVAVQTKKITTAAIHQQTWWCIQQIQGNWVQTISNWNNLKIWTLTKQQETSQERFLQTITDE